jgi:hypothetical protein
MAGERFATAQCHGINHHYLVTVHAGPDYHELEATDLFDAHNRMLDFARVNKLILTRLSGFHPSDHTDGRRADSNCGDLPGPDPVIVSRVAASRCPSFKRRS